MTEPVLVVRGLGLRIRRALTNATVGYAVSTAERWSRERDRLVDLIEPAGDTLLDRAELRRIIDLLSESPASGTARMTPAQWDAEVESLVAELLSAQARPTA